jgi:hypothetical protein
MTEHAVLPEPASQRRDVALWTRSRSGRPTRTARQGARPGLTFAVGTSMVPGTPWSRSYGASAQRRWRGEMLMNSESKIEALEHVTAMDHESEENLLNIVSPGASRPNGRQGLPPGSGYQLTPGEVTNDRLQNPSSRPLWASPLRRATSGASTTRSPHTSPSWKAKKWTR